MNHENGYSHQQPPAEVYSLNNVSFTDAKQDIEIKNLVSLAQTFPLPKHHHGMEVCENSGKPPVAVWVEQATVRGTCIYDEDFEIVVNPLTQDIGWSNDE